jgi:hypothetical protein
LVAETAACVRIELMHAGAHHRPKASSRFSWARVPSASAFVTFRLYRRDMHGVIHVEILRFPTSESRMHIACELLKARGRLLNLVDGIDLRILGVIEA